MRKYFYISLLPFLLVLLVAHQSAAAPINEDLARIVAQNFLNHINSSHLIENVDVSEAEGETIGYLVNLSPQGYILIAGDDIRVPIKAYSLNSSFSSLPAPYTEQLIRELVVPQLVMKSMTVEESVNIDFWAYLSSSSTKSFTTKSMYVPDTFLLESSWNQMHPYNIFLPEMDGQLTITGCTQTAVAQVLRYHGHPIKGKGVFAHTWNGQTLTAITNRFFNWPEMVDNLEHSSNAWEIEEVASLMLDIGIINRADFGVSGTSAGFNTTRFRQAFGYASIFTMWSDNSAFFDTIKNEIDNLRPVLLSLPGHMTVADGYSSDASGKNIHVNMGWGGASDDYYFLDQTIVAGPYSFPPSHTIYYNIKPCESDECIEPSLVADNDLSPVFVQPLKNLSGDGPRKVRIDVRDPDGKDVSLQAYSSCDPNTLQLENNMLLLDSSVSSQYCKVNVFATDDDGLSTASFTWLEGESGKYQGEEIDISGDFTHRNEIDEYTVYLGGDTTISGNRGFSNQAMYIWVEDLNGNTVVAASNETISTVLSKGYYTIVTSLTNPNGSYYTFDEDFSNYILSISVSDTLDEIAAYSGLELASCDFTTSISGDGSGAVSVYPDDSTCSTDCTVSSVCNSMVLAKAEPQSGSMFINWGGDCTSDQSETFFRVESGLVCTAHFSLDNDNDMMPDNWEIMYGLDITRDDSGADLDGDGTNNITEYRNGTIPNACEYSIMLSGDGSGSVSVQPDGSICTENCFETAACNSTVTLGATSQSGSMFTNWSGDCTGDELETLFRVESGLVCTANFTLDDDNDMMPDNWEIMYGLDITIDDSGADLDGDGTNNITEYRNGTIPNACEYSIMLSGDGSGSVSVQPDGSICTENCFETTTCNSTVTLGATSQSGSMFINWSSDCTGEQTETPFRVESGLVCTANFTLDNDNDMMPDSWETVYGLDITRDDSGDDPDGDGINNITEYHNGTIPKYFVGDLDGNGVISLSDAIIGLQILTGKPTNAILGSTVQGQRVTTADIIYIMRNSL